MPLDIVADASVLVNAFLFPQSVPGQVVKLADDGRYFRHISPILLDEMRDAILSPRLKLAYGHNERTVLAWPSSCRRRRATPEHSD